MPSPRKTAASFDLDDFERPDKAGPFSVTLGGREYTLVDVTELDYRELLETYQFAESGDFEPAIRCILPEEDRDEFFANKIPIYLFEELFDRYNKHHGIDPKKANASPPSSRGTGRR